MSSQPCGCDPEANWQCDRHRAEFCERMNKLIMDPREERIKELYKNHIEKGGTVWFDVNDPSKHGAIPLSTQSSRATMLPTDAKDRKRFPVATGVLDYFPDALIAVAEVSLIGNEQHNPGEPLHWARGKSTDQEDTMLRHFLERGTRDTDGARHTAKMVWRALAILQLEIEAERKG